MRSVEIEVRAEGVYLADTDIAVPCQWFARCDRLATLVQPHPILGEVPTCARCAAIGR